MTTALIASAAAAVSPAAAAMPAAAKGTSMNPPCAIDEYASMRTMLVWRNAVRLPRVIDATARIQSTGVVGSVGVAWGACLRLYKMLMKATKPPA